jgi:hypothetical protein
MVKVHALAGGALAALLVLAAPCAAAAESPQSMVVVRDPVTGELRPATPAESRALKARNPSLAPERGIGPLTVRDDGSRKVHLGERRQAYSVVTRDAEGKLAMQCMNSEAAADAAVRQPAAAATTTGEHDHDAR